MPKHQKTLAEMQEECRRFAAEIGNPEASRILSRAAEDLEGYVRQSQTGGAATKH